MKNDLIFLKLGGSLITDKNTARLARTEELNRLVVEIASALASQRGLRLLLGHGSGSFGHIPAKKFGTRDGVWSEEQWRGFAEVWHDARALNNIVMDCLHQHRIPAVAFAPCSMARTASHKIISWDIAQIESSLKNGVVPVIYGDVVFDTEIGGTILSTEEQFEYLSAELKPARILLAGIEAGVWRDFPARKSLFSTISAGDITDIEATLAASESPDVTGGMRSKVMSMIQLVENGDCDQVEIFSGIEPGNLLRALGGEKVGTRICL